MTNRSQADNDAARDAILARVGEALRTPAARPHLGAGGLSHRPLPGGFPFWPPRRPVPGCPTVATRRLRVSGC